MTSKPSPTNPPTAADPREFAVGVVRILRKAGHEALFAGGCVRDQLRGEEPKDYDVATSALPDEVQRIFPRTLPIGASFGVVQVRGRGGMEVEVATFRADGAYSDGRRPDSVRFVSAREDALRRDFTINGMFFDPVGDDVIDHVGGQADLAAGLIRAIGDPSQRFAEDKLRLLRAVRFAARFGFRIEAGTMAAIQSMADQLTVVSAERILQELRRMLEPPTRTQAFDLLVETGLLGVVLPELAAADAELLARLRATLGSWQAEASFPLALAALLSAAPPRDSARLAEATCRRLKASNEDRERCVWLCARRDDLAGASALRPHVLKRLFIEPGVDELLLLLSGVGGAADAEFCRRWAADQTPESLNPPPLITGDMLLAAGYRAGPKFKTWLERIRDQQLDGELRTQDEAMAAVQAMAAE